MKLCTAPVLDSLCGEPALTSRCDLHPRPSTKEHKTGREARGYDDAWRKLSIRARELQPWCSRCGTSEDLTADHLQWPATTLKHVDVLCRSCNAKKGAPTEANDPRRHFQQPRGEGARRLAPHPRAQGKSTYINSGAMEFWGSQGG